MIALLARYWYLVAIAALVALLGASHMRANGIKTDYANFRAAVAEANLKAVEAARIEGERKQSIADEEAAHARDEKQILQADVRRLADHADGLRGDVDAWRKRAAAARSCTTDRSAGEPSSAPTDLLADLYLGLVRAGQATSEFAEGVASAGSACERISDRARTR